MELPNMSMFDRAFEMSTSTVIQPHRIRMIQEEEQVMIQGEEHDIDAVAYPQNFPPPPGAPAPQEEREEQGAHYMLDLLLNCIMGESGCLNIFQEFEHYLFGQNSSSDCDAPEDDSSDEETKEDDDDDDVAIADGQSNAVNVREQENHDEDFPLSPVHFEDEELTGTENGVDNEVPLSDSKQELQILQSHTSAPQSHTSAPQTHATLDQLISFPSLASSTSTVKGGAASTVSRAAEEPENNTSEDAVNDTSKC